MLEYNMDLLPESHFQIITPDENAKSFNYFVTEYGRYRVGADYFTRRDGKDAALLIFTVSGEGALEWNGQSCRLIPGSAVVINCDSYHYYRTVSAEPWDFYWVHFGSNSDGCMGTLTEQLKPVLLTDTSGMRRYFDDLEDVGHMGGLLTWAEMSHAISGMLLEMMRSLLHAKNVHQLRRKEINQLAEYIRANYNQDLTIDNFIAVANLSKYHLIRLFRQQMGTPPYSYMHHCRINNAQQLLRTSDMSVSEIARQVGYTDSVTFIRHFKKIVGVTPTQYVANSIQLPTSNT